MTDAVVEVGPATIRGPRALAADTASVALDGIDDGITLLDEQPVDVTALWRHVFRCVLPDDVDDAVVVCPSWWPPSRIDLIREAATASCAKTTVRHRAEILTQDLPGTPTVIEIASEFVALVRDGRVVRAEPRIGDDADIAGAISGETPSGASVVVDAPIGVVGSGELAKTISDRLRSGGVAVTTMNPDRVLAARPRPSTSSPLTVGSSRRVMPAAMTAAAIASVALLCIGLGAYSSPGGPRDGDAPTSLLVEGRVAVVVPALWPARRITSGAGSARLQVTAPDDSAAVLITQARVRAGETLSETAAALRSALDSEHGDTFTGFNPADRRGDRPAVTYRELRPGRQVDWTVFADDGLRIGIGCRCAPGAEEAVRYACEQAVRTAHTAF